MWHINDSVIRINNDSLFDWYIKCRATIDNDGKTTGRPGVGLIETLVFFMGLTGDPDDLSTNWETKFIYIAMMVPGTRVVRQ